MRNTIELVQMRRRIAFHVRAMSSVTMVVSVSRNTECGTVSRTALELELRRKWISDRGSTVEGRVTNVVGVDTRV